MTTTNTVVADDNLSQQIASVLENHKKMLDTPLDNFSEAEAMLTSCQAVLSMLETAYGANSEVLQQIADHSAVALLEFCVNAIFVEDRHPADFPASHYDNMVRDDFPGREHALKPEAFRTEMLRKEAVRAEDIVKKLCELPLSPEMAQRVQPYPAKFKAEREVRAKLAGKRHHEANGLNPDNLKKPGSGKGWVVAVVVIAVLYFILS